MLVHDSWPWPAWPPRWCMIHDPLGRPPRGWATWDLLEDGESPTTRPTMKSKDPRTFQEPEPNLLQCAKNGMLFKIKTARCVQHDRFSKLLIKSFHLHRRLQNGSLACKNYHSTPPSLPRAWAPRRFCAPKPLPRIAPRKLPRRQQYHLAAMSNG